MSFLFFPLLFATLRVYSLIGAANSFKDLSTSSESKQFTLKWIVTAEEKYIQTDT
jgi:hypothetical protein